MNEFIKYQPKKNIAYLLNPKVACTTIQNSLLNGNVENVHDINNFPAYNNSSVPIFTVVRNPFDRAVSAYLDKVSSKKDLVVWNNFVSSLGKQVNYDISFEDYLDILMEHPNLSQADKHFRPQVDNMHGITPSFIGYLEDMDSVKLHLSDFNIEIINKIPHKTNTKNKRNHLLSSESIINKVRILYKNDFDAFGYSSNPGDKFNLRPIINIQKISDDLVSKHINTNSDYLADIFRKAALICEEKDKEVAFKLASLALDIRPNGPVIKEIHNRLNRLNTSN
ncbi:sulfotransferase family 2 domain-containing protein [Photobacterium leiognathi]|uniref:sulfotransferase family 2 domain-containing protein n=1 Tax=Photobacterium leiognathi TaxID=553611 RepID=UPI00076A4AAA|nr:sulfotransferase family 2 domain-containing protein [Photobacterium leiognathi]